MTPLPAEVTLFIETSRREDASGMWPGVAHPVATIVLPLAIIVGLHQKPGGSYDVTMEGISPVMRTRMTVGKENCVDTVAQVRENSLSQEG